MSTALSAVPPATANHARTLHRASIIPLPPCNFPVGIEDPSTLNRFKERLVQRGYTDDESRGVLGDNGMNIFEKIWSTA